MTTATASTVGELFAAAVAESRTSRRSRPRTAPFKRQAIAANYATEIEGIYAGS
jgi:hypothetical protein